MQVHDRKCNKSIEREKRHCYIGYSTSTYLRIHKRFKCIKLKLDSNCANATLCISVFAISVLWVSPTLIGYDVKEAGGWAPMI